MLWAWVVCCAGGPGMGYQAHRRLSLSRKVAKFGEPLTHIKVVLCSKAFLCLQVFTQFQRMFWGDSDLATKG